MEVDLEYPDEIHNHHNDYPLAPESKEITFSMLSEYSKQIGRHIYGEDEKIPKCRKLVPHLGPRKNYIIHLENLRQCLQLGMKLVHVHRVMTFHQSAWLKPYIDLNTEKRNSNEFEKDFFKLMNNSVFGKSCENVRNRCNVELVMNSCRLRRLTDKPSFRRFKIFSNDLVGVEYIKTSICLNKPLYAGFATLELSKTLMYDFHYNVVKARYGGQAQLLFTDTDSLCYHIETQDIYKDMAEMSHFFDTSNFDPSHPLYSKDNAKVLGKMKDELPSDPGVDFVGLRPKMYSIMTRSGVQKNTAKGVPRAVSSKELRHEEYTKVLISGSRVLRTCRRIRQRDLQLMSTKFRKVALSAFDDKRHICRDGITTHAHGHYLIQKNEVEDFAHDLRHYLMCNFSSDEEELDEKVQLL